MYTISTATTSATTSEDIWDQWIGTGTTTITWETWCNEGTTTGTGSIILAQYQINQAEREQRIKAQQQCAEERAAKRKLASEKAIKLLKQILNKKQYQDYKKKGYFYIESEKGRRYRIRKDSNINVDLMTSNHRVFKKYCAHPGGDYPIEDIMICQKIMLEHRENDFLEIANEYAA